MIEDKYLEFIKKVLSKYLKTYKVYLFGSRAKGNNRKYSDIDLAVKSDELTSYIKSQIEAEFENSTIPYEVDVVDLNTVSKDFLNLIKDSMIEL